MTTYENPRGHENSAIFHHSAISARAVLFQDIRYLPDNDGTVHWFSHAVTLHKRSILFMIFDKETSMTTTKYLQTCEVGMPSESQNRLGTMVTELGTVPGKPVACISRVPR